MSYLSTCDRGDDQVAEYVGPQLIKQGSVSELMKQIRQTEVVKAAVEYQGEGLAGFLDRQGLNIVRDFGGYVWQTSDRVIAHAKGIAARAGRPYIFQRRVVHGKDDLARQIAKRDGITQGLICVLGTVELATWFALTGGGRIVPRDRKCLAERTSCRGSAYK